MSHCPHEPASSRAGFFVRATLWRGEGFGVVALEEVAVVPVVHVAATAVFPLAAGGAGAGAGPSAVTEFPKTVFPNVPEAVVVNVPLGEGVPVYVGTCTDAAVYQDRCDIHAGVTEVWDVPDLFFVSAQIPFATEGHFHGSAFHTLGLDEFHERDEFPARKVHVRVGRRPADGDNGEQAPLLNAHILQDAVHAGKGCQVPLVHAGDYIGTEAGIFGKQADGPEGAAITPHPSAHPVVRILQPVETDGERAHSGSHEPGMHVFVVKPAVGDHTPVHAALSDFHADGFYVGPKQRLPSGENHQEVLGDVLLGKGIQRREEILQRHVLFPALNRAVAAAVTAVKVAAGCTLPKQVVQFVHFYLIVPEQAEKHRVHTANIIRFREKSCICHARFHREEDSFLLEFVIFAL